MKISKKAKTGCAVVLAALMTLTGLSMKQTYAAIEVELNRDCSITISADIGANNEQQSPEEKADFSNSEVFIPITLYRVADVDVTGQNYEANEAFKVISEDLKGINSSTTADQWLDMAKKAAVSENLEAAKANDTVENPLFWETKTSGGVAKISGLKPGMYLVVPEQTYNADYSVLYTFTPYLTALPSSVYTLSGSGSDDWIYDTKIGLKPQADPQTGSLKIVKTLQSYNETLEKATFSFRIQGYDKNNVEVYNNVVGITCPGEDGSYTQSAEISGFPVGLRMVVTEEYSGASYELVSGGMVHDIIVSDEAFKRDPNRWPEAEAQFVNKYNGGNKGGYGVTNHFDNAGQDSNGNSVWQWKDPDASPASEEN